MHRPPSKKKQAMDHQVKRRKEEKTNNLSPESSSRDHQVKSSRDHQLNRPPKVPPIKKTTLSCTCHQVKRRKEEKT
jgi:hypothetical protein